jgi:hypothetical protein
MSPGALLNPPEKPPLLATTTTNTQLPADHEPARHETPQQHAQSHLSPGVVDSHLRRRTYSHRLRWLRLIYVTGVMACIGFIRKFFSQGPYILQQLTAGVYVLTVVFDGVWTIISFVFWVSGSFMGIPTSFRQAMGTPSCLLIMYSSSHSPMSYVNINILLF